MTILGARSFDCGDAMLNSADVLTPTGITISASGSDAKTGGYSLRFFSISASLLTYWARWALSGTPANPSVSAWVNMSGNYNTNDSLRISFVLGTGELVEARWNSVTHTFDGYVDGALFAAGAFEVSQNTWFHVQLYTIIADAGSMAMLIDGHSNFSQVGDTQPGMATGATHLRIGFVARASTTYIDDLVFGFGGLLGCLYCEDIRPSGDSAVQWTPSTGVDNFATVDETPVSTADYNYTDVTGQKDLLSLGAFDGTGRVVSAVATWVQSQMVDAAGDSLIVGVSSNGVESDSAHAVSAAFEFYQHLDETDPNTGAAWSEVGVNAALLKYESVIT